MLMFAQILIDVIFAVGLLVLAAAHLANRSTSAELDEIRDYVDEETGKLWADIRVKMDGEKKSR